MALSQEIWKLIELRGGYRKYIFLIRRGAGPPLPPLLLFSELALCNIRFDINLAMF